MKIVTIIGARPQFVKAAVVSHALNSVRDCQEIIVHTGQHFDGNMSEIFFSELDIPAPRFNLCISQGSHGRQTGRMLEAIEKVLIREEPDMVLVYGDTNSTLAGALAAVKLHICVAHVEAGLRSFNHHMPEEINRVMTDHISDMLFAPSKSAVENLKSEGLADEKIHNVGDVMFDAAIKYGNMAEKKSRILDEFGLIQGNYVLATIHRAENTDDVKRLMIIFDAFCELSREIQIVLPLHPRTKKMLNRLGLMKKITSKLMVLEPVGFLDMILLEKNSCLVVTDSGGVQKEAFFYQVPCVTLRDETEWVELVGLGWNYLLPPHEPVKLIEGLKNALNAPLGNEDWPYGRGNAAEKIADLLGSHPILGSK